MNYNTVNKNVQIMNWPEVPMWLKEIIGSCLFFNETSEKLKKNMRLFRVADECASFFFWMLNKER